MNNGSQLSFYLSDFFKVWKHNYKQLFKICPLTHFVLPYNYCRLLILEVEKQWQGSQGVSLYSRAMGNNQTLWLPWKKSVYLGKHHVFSTVCQATGCPSLIGEVQRIRKLNLLLLFQLSVF